MKTLAYKDAAEKNAFISQETANGLVLLEEQNHIDGDFLVFGEPKSLSTDERIAALELRVVELEKKP